MVMRSHLTLQVIIANVKLSIKNHKKPTQVKVSSGHCIAILLLLMQVKKGLRLCYVHIKVCANKVRMMMARPCFDVIHWCKNEQKMNQFLITFDQK